MSHEVASLLEKLKTTVIGSHVTPSFLTDDEEEFKSNIDLGKSRLIFEFYLDISPSHYGVT